MSRYADRECSDCLQLFPTNIMRRQTERRKSGESRRRLKSGSYSTTEHFKLVEIFPCPARAEARDRRARFMMIAVAVAVGVLLIIGALGESNAPPATAPATVAEAPTMETTAADVAPVETTPREAEPAAPDPEPVAQAEAPAAPAPVEAMRPAAPAGDPIEDAIAVAASSGQTTRWQVAGGAGYAVPSGAQDGPDGACRNVLVSRDGREDDAQMQRWCSRAGAAWERQPWGRRRLGEPARRSASPSARPARRFALGRELRPRVRRI